MEQNVNKMKEIKQMKHKLYFNLKQTKNVH